jgi:hypothetical protein
MPRWIVVYPASGQRRPVIRPSGGPNSLAREGFCPAAVAREGQSPSVAGRFCFEAMNVSSDDKDFHLAVHESSHALVGVCLNGPGQIGLVTIEAGAGYAGRVEGVAGDQAFVGLSPSDVCSVAKTLWPGRFEARSDVAEFFLHATGRVTELLAGSIGEELLTAGPLLPAPGDQSQALEFARLLCTSPQSVTAFLEFAATEARGLIEANKSVILELAAALQAKRTIKGPEIDQIVAVALAQQDLEHEHRRRRKWIEVTESARNFEAAHRA